MLSNVEYTAPQYIEEDKNITIQFITIKNGVESDPTEVQLTAKAIAPTAPECGETISGEPNSYVEFSVNTEPNTTIEIVSCSFGTATANGSNIKIVFGDIEEDREVTLIVKAKRGKFESPELTISGNCVIPVPAEPAITGVEEMDENTIQEFQITNKEENAVYTAEATLGTISESGDKFVFSAPNVTKDTQVTLTFKAQRKSKVSTTTKTILVKNVLVPSASLEIANEGELKVQKGQTLDVTFKDVKGTLSVENKAEFYGTAVVQGNKVVVSGVESGTAKFSVTQTEDDKAPSAALEFDVKVYEVSAKLVANSSNATEVKVQKSIELSFDNVLGTLAVNNTSDLITTAIETDKIRVTGVKNGTAKFSVTQTESGKEPSEALDITIEVKAAEVQPTEPEKSATLELADKQVQTTDSATPLDIQFKNLTGTLSAEITEGSEFGSIAVESNKITLTPSAAGTIKISAQQTESNKTKSDALAITITITAQKVKVVKFNANEGTGTMEDVRAPLGSYTIPGCSFTAPDGKQFKCWAESADGKTNPHNEGDSVTFGLEGEFTLYAIWETKAEQAE